MNRFDANRVHWSDYGDVFLVVCPNCARKAEVKPAGVETAGARSVDNGRPAGGWLLRAALVVADDVRP